MRNPLAFPIPEILLRVAVAFSFLYPPLHALIDPYAWIGYFPAFVTSLAYGNEIVLLHAFGILEVLIALWILFAKRPFLPALMAAALLLAIVVVNGAQFPILFRDVAIALAALSLALMHRPAHG